MKLLGKFLSYIRIHKIRNTTTEIEEERYKEMLVEKKNIRREMHYKIRSTTYTQ